MKPIIDYDSFSCYMTQIIKEYDFEIDRNKLNQKYGRYTACYSEPVIDYMIRLLCEVMKDEEEWIRYFLDDLNCGRFYKDGIITDADGKNIPLATIKDLWDLLIRDMEEIDEG